MAKTMIMGIGVPGCGKTTYLKPLAERRGLTYINADDIRKELTGDETNHTMESKVWGILYRRVDEALRKDGAVVDATFTRPRDRKRLIDAAKRADATNIEGYWFNPTIDTCLGRNKQRARFVPEDVLRTMHDRLINNPPSIDEGFTIINTIVA